MPRTKNSAASRKRRKKVLERAKGYRQARSKSYKRAREFSEKGLTYAYNDRKKKKRNFRRLWIKRISVACQMHGISYSKFMNGMKKEAIALNRKSLAEMAFSNPEEFSLLVEKIKKGLNE